MGADISDKINSPKGRQDHPLRFLGVLHPPQFLFEQSYIVPLKEIKPDKETEQAEDIKSGVGSRRPKANLPHQNFLVAMFTT